MNKKIWVSVPMEVEISPKQKKELAIDALTDLLGEELQGANSLYVEDGGVWRVDDYGHHRGGVSKERVFTANELDRHIVRAIMALKGEMDERQS